MINVNEIRLVSDDNRDERKAKENNSLEFHAHELMKNMINQIKQNKKEYRFDTEKHNISKQDVTSLQRVLTYLGFNVSEKDNTLVINWKGFEGISEPLTVNERNVYQQLIDLQEFLHYDRSRYTHFVNGYIFNIENNILAYARQGFSNFKLQRDIGSNSRYNIEKTMYQDVLKEFSKRGYTVLTNWTVKKGRIILNATIDWN